MGGRAGWITMVKVCEKFPAHDVYFFTFKT